MFHSCLFCLPLIDYIIGKCALTFSLVKVSKYLHKMHKQLCFLVRMHASRSQLSRHIAERMLCPAEHQHIKLASIWHTYGSVYLADHKFKSICILVVENFVEYSFF